MTGIKGQSHRRDVAKKFGSRPHVFESGLQIEVAFAEPAERDLRQRERQSGSLVRAASGQLRAAAHHDGMIPKRLECQKRNRSGRHLRAKLVSEGGRIAVVPAAGRARAIQQEALGFQHPRGGIECRPCAMPSTDGDGCPGCRFDPTEGAAGPRPALQPIVLTQRRRLWQRRSFHREQCLHEGCGKGAVIANGLGNERSLRVPRKVHLARMHVEQQPVPARPGDDRADIDGIFRGMEGQQREYGGLEP